MNNQIFSDGTVTYYALKVRGVVQSAKFANSILAEQQKVNLAPEDQLIAEVVVVDVAGNELLLG